MYFKFIGTNIELDDLVSLRVSKYITDTDK